MEFFFSDHGYSYINTFFSDEQYYAVQKPFLHNRHRFIQLLPISLHIMFQECVIVKFWSCSHTVTFYIEFLYDSFLFSAKIFFILAISSARIFVERSKSGGAFIFCLFLSCYQN
jgi:hypothetical protein